MSEGAVVLIIFATLFPGLILVALVVKLVEVRRVKRWPETTGKVVASRVQSRRNEQGDPGYDFHDTEVTNEPFVQYEYAVGSQKYRCSRIDIGEKTSGFELEAILDRYPVGAEVTVYYNPADPSKAMLERDLPRVAYLGMGCLLVVFVGGPLLAMLVYHNSLDWLKPHLANPQSAPFVAASGGFGLAVFLFALGMYGVVRRASRWPTTQGRIISSGPETVVRRDTETGARRTMYRSSVV